MNKIKNVVICILVILVVVLAFMVIKKGDVSDNVDTNPNVNDEDNVQIEDTTIMIEEEIVEQFTKQAIINIAKHKYSEDLTENVVPAEGHIVWLTRVEENTLYVYVETEYGIYKKDNLKISAVNSNVTHILFTFDIISEEELELVEYTVLKENEKSQWTDSITEIFTDAVLEIIEKEPDTSLYQDQIETYLNEMNNEIN